MWSGTSLRTGLKPRAEDKALGSSHVLTISSFGIDNRFITITVRYITFALLDSVASVRLRFNKMSSNKCVTTRRNQRHLLNADLVVISADGVWFHAYAECLRGSRQLEPASTMTKLAHKPVLGEMIGSNGNQSEFRLLIMRYTVRQS